MPTNSPFLAAYVNHSECELYLVGHEIVAFVPTRDNWECQITLGTTDFVTATIVVREMGLEATWN